LSRTAALFIIIRLDGSGSGIDYYCRDKPRLKQPGGNHRIGSYHLAKGEFETRQHSKGEKKYKTSYNLIALKNVAER
jgi:hypothetical protein